MTEGQTQTPTRRDTVQLPHLTLSFLVAKAKGETQLITKCTFSLRCKQAAVS